MSTREHRRRQIDRYLEKHPGATSISIARKLGISRSYVADIRNDPEGVKTVARKKSYGGACRHCGRRTDGSNGRANAPSLCGDCSRRNQRIWTRETVIAAIQAWAAEHGRPPSASQWRRSEHGHPAAVSVYGPRRPFAYWSDAIEAAGYPRPQSGYWNR